MDRQQLRYLAAVLAAGVAVIHLFHPRLGFPRLVSYLQFGTLADPRPLLFTIGGGLIFIGILLAYNGVMVRQVYLGGIVLMATFILGYFAWHTVLDHGAFWPHIPAHGHRDTGIVETVTVHLLDDDIALMSKLSELAVLVVLLVLYPDRSG